MILNAYAVLDLFTSVVRSLLALSLVVSGVIALRSWRKVLIVDARSKYEDRGYWLCILGGALLALSLAAWPLFYLLLHSYIPHWEGVMCVYGVTQVGQGSQGASRFLPGIVRSIEIMRPVFLFLIGAWFLAYFVNRACSGGMLGWRTSALAIFVGAVGLADAGLETAYLVIPKAEQQLASGCCSAARAGTRRPAAESRTLEASTVAWIGGAGILSVGGTLLGLAASWALPTGRRSMWWLGCLVAGSVAVLATMSYFLPHVAAPRLLHLPRHHCVYCMLSQVPDSIATMLMLTAGAFFVGWAAVAQACLEASRQDVAAEFRDRCLRWALVAYLGFAIMLCLQLFLA
jgi:hypothetical protein